MLPSRRQAMALVCCDSFRDHTAVAQELKAALTEFVRFAQTLLGDAKSEAQPFLTDDRIQPPSA